MSTLGSMSLLVPPGAAPPGLRPEMEAAHAGMCTCGARVPLQVRLHLRSRTRPVFHGRWCCGQPCLRARLRTALRRESAREPEVRVHRHRVPVGLLLLASGAISHAALQHALRVQRETGERIGDVLVRECGLQERKITEALAAQWGCEAWDVRGARPERLASLAPRSVLQGCGMVPLRLAKQPLPLESSLTVVFADRFEPRAIYAFRRIHGLLVEPGIVPASQWDEVSTRLHAGGTAPLEEFVCDSIEEIESVAIKVLRRLQPVESRLARLGDVYWMRTWLEPAALLGGPLQTEDVVDATFRLSSSSGGSSASGAGTAASRGAAAA